MKLMFKLLVVTAALFCAVIAAGDVIFQHIDRIRASDFAREAEARRAAEKAQVSQPLQDWLASQGRGEAGLEYWATDKDWVHPITLYAVTDYKIVDDRYACERTVRIHSATKGGTPVTRLWRAHISDGKITMIEPAQE